MGDTIVLKAERPSVVGSHFPRCEVSDGKKAVDDATKACELTEWKNGDYLDTLASTHAEAGDFPNAVKWEEKAIELAPENSKGELRSRLDLFKAHKPYREEVGIISTSLNIVGVFQDRRFFDVRHRGR